MSRLFSLTTREIKAAKKLSQPVEFRLTACSPVHARSPAATRPLASYSLPRSFRRARSCKSRRTDRALVDLPLRDDKGENAPAEFAREARHAGWRFSFKRLSIQTSLAGDHKIDIVDFRFESGRFRDNVEARPNSCAAKSRQTESESAGRAGARLLAMIETKLFATTSASRVNAVSNLSSFRTSRPLRTEHSRRAIFSEQRISHVNRAVVVGNNKVLRPFDSFEAPQDRELQ